MSISSRITSITEHVAEAYDKIEDVGVDLTNVNKNIENISSLVESIYDEYPNKVTGEGTNISLLPTKKAKINIDIKGDMTQFELPSGYTAIDYIESTGTQYIDTQYFNVSNNIEVKIGIAITNQVASEIDIIGNQDGRTGRFVIGYDPRSSVGFFAYSRYGSASADSNARISMAYSQNTKYNIIAKYDWENNLKTITVNDTTAQSSFNSSIISSRNTIKILQSGNNSLYATGRIYYAKIYDNDMLIRDMIPCINENNEIGLYDKVSGTFFGNQGTGTFVAGPVIPGEIIVVTGQQNIEIANSDSTLSQLYSLSLGSLELCKIGAFQDYIYKNNQWYKKAYIGKVVLNGSEELIKNNSDSSNYLYTLEMDDMQLSDYLLSNKLFYKSLASINSGNSIDAVGISNSDISATTLYMNVGFYLQENTVSALKNWLSNNNLIVYYVLEEPVDILITDNTLITQLNALEKAQSYDEQTDITVFGDLPAIVSASALMGTIQDSEEVSY